MTKLILFITVLFTTFSIAQQNATKQNLNSNYQIKIGDYSALLLNNFLEVNKDLDAPFICTFESEPNTIDLEIFGARSRVEGVRETVNDYWETIESTFIPYMERKFNVVLEKKDFRILYYDRTARNGAKLILQLIGGQFVIPQN